MRQIILAARYREITAFDLPHRRGLNGARVSDALEGCTVKRSRRVVLTMMGSAAVGAASMGFVPYDQCGPGRTGDGRILCRATYGGFGGTFFDLHHHGHHPGHGHAGG
jgi:hypothetical protein